MRFMLFLQRNLDDYKRFAKFDFLKMFYKIVNY